MGTNLVDQYKLFEDKYLHNTDNVFEAINSMCEDANKLHSQYGGIISHKECLTSVLTESLPEDLEKRKLVATANNRYMQSYIDNALAEVDDIRVKSSVQITLKVSQVNKNLVFQYLQNLTKSQKARVRILSRVIWNNLYVKGEVNA